jgi:nucleoside-triphosphatase
MLKLEKYGRERGFKIGGIITQEVRENEQRIGFKLRDVSSGREGWLARKNSGDGPRIGGYTVVTDDLEKIGVRALEASASFGGPDVVLVDEIGPMELTSQGFRDAVLALLNSGKILIATVKLNLPHKELEAFVKNVGAMRIILTKENRDSALELVASTLQSWLRTS